MKIDLEKLLDGEPVAGAQGCLDHRLDTIRKTVELLDRLQPKILLETGCQWTTLLHAHGMSTTIFGALAKRYNAILYTIEFNQEHLEKCRALSREYSENIVYIRGDSLEVLEQFDDTIDFLYLDSFDFSIGQEEPSRRHQLKEIELAYPKLAETSVVLLDDANVQMWFDKELDEIDAQGKTYYSHQFLIQHGANCLFDIPHYQRLYRISKKGGNIQT